ncbi:MAG: hypothetical protein EKK40_10970 [Bradyrhizobiaceae bacterium]|nr:MAG: hypothetical protein EKK40_10970 [Bradyrhizobiaceae bacterium]
MMIGLSEEFLANALVRKSRLNRYQAIGEDVNGVISVAFAVLGLEGISVISMRPASSKERKLYREHQKSK